MPSGMSKRKQSSFGSLDLRACYEYMINQRLSLRCSNRDKNYLVVSYKICMYDTPQYETRARRPFSLLTVPKCIQNVIHPPPVLITVYNVVNKTKKKKKEKRKKRREKKKKKRSQLRAIPLPIEHCRLQAVSDNPRRKPTKSVRFRGCFVFPRANSAAILRLFARRRSPRNLPSGCIESSSL